MPLKRVDKVVHKNMTRQEREERHKVNNISFSKQTISILFPQNLISFEDHHLDCPESDVIKYRATLGHKVNHSFRPNADFCCAKHPRFGRIRCLQAVETIGKGQEILANYGYNPDSPFTPGWFKELHSEWEDSLLNWTK